jgi:hypothetical protein
MNAVSRRTALSVDTKIIKSRPGCKLSSGTYHVSFTNDDGASPMRVGGMHVKTASSVAVFASVPEPSGATACVSFHRRILITTNRTSLRRRDGSRGCSLKLPCSPDKLMYCLFFIGLSDDALSAHVIKSFTVVLLTSSFLTSYFQFNW